VLWVCSIIPCSTMLTGTITGGISLGGAVGSATLSGAQQPSAVSSTAFGYGTVVLSGADRTVSVSLSLSGLVGQSAAHLHLGGRCFSGTKMMSPA
jgi:hypothetical protein